MDARTVGKTEGWTADMSVGGTDEWTGERTDTRQSDRRADGRSGRKGRRTGRSVGWSDGRSEERTDGPMGEREDGEGDEKIAVRLGRTDGRSVASSLNQAHGQ